MAEAAWSPHAATIATIANANRGKSDPKISADELNPFSSRPPREPIRITIRDLAAMYGKQL